MKEWHAFEDLIRQSLSNTLVWAGQENILSARPKENGKIVLSMYDEETVNRFRNELAATEAFLAEIDQRVETANTQRDIVVIVNQFICEKLEYNYELLEKWDNISLEEKEHYNELAAVVYGTGTVCAGYSNLFKLLCERYGIQTENLRSKDRNHAWSANLIDGQWLYTDATWNDIVGNNNWLLLTREEMQKTHEFSENWTN